MNSDGAELQGDGIDLRVNQHGLQLCTQAGRKLAIGPITQIKTLARIPLIDIGTVKLVLCEFWAPQLVKLAFRLF
ncbi:hypothetical protein LP414_26945 [Polaromonas sp. P1(28)-13]|nr:hypothetical protein LP417_26920 [Polaromonas sp. P1-6]UUZ70628.1 hypothetical protein LP416_25265 [Polaromonas sp. P2-4]UUZ78642.1 hypothetical protein LP414_26945 [Polaromonas sp. P1(28)-13]